MDDNLIYYLVLGAIYLVTRVLKKKKPQTPTAPPAATEEAREYNKPVLERPAPAKPSSFEELLREISQEFEHRKEPQQSTQILEPVVIEEPTPKPEELTREQKYVNKKRKEAAEEKERKRLIRLVEDENEHESHAVLELLYEKGGAANAVVLAEILNRRS